MTPLDPLLKWPGGKRKIAPRISALLPDPSTLHEPFTGSAAVFLHLRPPRAVLSDANAGLINFHRVVRDRPHDLIQAAQQLPLGTDWKAHYYAIREEYNTLPRDSVHQAARLLWLNRTAFNGLYRENSNGGMNAPTGDYKEVRLPEAAHILAVSEALQVAEIHTCDFEEALSHVEDGDAVYLDPPYDPLTTSANFATYSKGGFTWSDQERLARCAADVALKARVVASNHATERIVNLYSSYNFEISMFDLKRSIGRTAESRGAVVQEILAHNTPTPSVARPSERSVSDAERPFPDSPDGSPLGGVGVSSLSSYLERLRAQ